MRVHDYGRRIVRDLGAHQRRCLLAALTAMTAGAVLKALTPVALGVAIDRMLTGHGGAVLEPLLLVGALLFAAQALDVARRLLVENVATAFECDNRTRAYAHLLRLPLAMLGRQQVGALQGNANRSVEGCAKLLKLLAADLLPALVGAIAAVGVVLAKDPLIGLIMVMVVPTGFALTRWQVADQAGVRVRIRAIKDTIDGRVGGQLPMVESIRSAGAEAHFDDQTATACQELRAIEYGHHRAMALFDALKSANEGLWQVVALGAAVYASGGGLGAVGDVTTYALLYTTILGPLREMHRIVDEASESAQQAGDFYRLLDTPADPAYVAGAPALAVGDPGAAVQLRGVSYAHEDGGAALLCGVDLTVARGERVGIVGRSGCGKSTLLRLLRRIHHGYEGSIALGGADLASLSHAELSERVAYVTQTAQIVHGTVEENIRFGDDTATIEEVMEAARRARVHDEIVAMPGGYGFVLAERGDNVSGGQRQRICIARALLRRPRLLLLDEPTSALDPASERAVQRTIDALDDVTVMIVAHRLSTLRTVDRVVVLDGGRVAESGSYAELAGQGGLFAAMLAEGEREAPGKEVPMAA